MKILLFDVDGTLVRAGGAGRDALNQACEELYGFKRVCDRLDLRGRSDLKNFRLAYRFCRGREAAPGELKTLVARYLKALPHYVKLAFRERRYVVPPGIKTLLRRLSRTKGILLGLGTGNLETGARIKLEPGGLNGYFRFGGFGSDSIDRPTLLRKAVERATGLTGTRGKAPRRGGLNGREVFVIGDTPLDVEAGRKNGYRTIAVGTGFCTMRELCAAKPDHLAKDFKDTKKWLRWFGIK